MGVRTGNPRGRPKGAKNKRTVERQEAAERAAQAIEKVIPGVFRGDAHAYLMAVYKDPMIDVDMRLRAATAAIRFEKPALSTIDANVGSDSGLNITIKRYSGS